jgi:hypothetical protein
MRLIGCYGFGRDPWRLVEIAFYDLEQQLDLKDLKTRNGKPVPLHELHLLDGSGTRAVHGGVAAAPGDVPQLLGDIRVCFFVEVDDDATLTTPFGELYLGSTTPKPHRLRFVEFFMP